MDTHFNSPFSVGRGLAPSPDCLFFIKSEPLGEPVNPLASFKIERETPASVHTAHNFGFLDKPHTDRVYEERELGFTRSSQRVTGERGFDFARDTAHLEVVARAERL